MKKEHEEIVDFTLFSLLFCLFMIDLLKTKL